MLWTCKVCKAVKVVGGVNQEFKWAQEFCLPKLNTEPCGLDIGLGLEMKARMGAGDP